MILSIAAVIAGLALLVWSADRFVVGASGLAQAAGISPLVIGMLVVGFGTSSPELAVSTLAAIDGSSGIAIGNVVGSNIANVALILGICGLIRPLALQSRILQRELPMTLGVSIALVLMLLNGTLGRIDGLLLVCGLLGFLAWNFYSAKSVGKDALAEELAEEIPAQIPTGQAVFWIVAGLVLLIGSSQLLIWGAVNIAQALGVSDLIIGLTIVAIGTSLPELAASVAGLLKNEQDIAIGNVLGSNILNILAVLIAPAMIDPGPIPDPMLLWRDLPVMVGTMVLLYISASGLRGNALKIERVDGALLLTAYIAYTLILVFSARPS